VIIADTRSSMVAADSAAAVGCAFDFDFDVDVDFHPMLAQRALSGGVASTPLDVARSAWEYSVKFGALAPGKA
jgi:hypothetical protein